MQITTQKGPDTAELLVLPGVDEFVRQQAAIPRTGGPEKDAVAGGQATGVLGEQAGPQAEPLHPTVGRQGNAGQREQPHPLGMRDAQRAGVGELGGIKGHTDQEDVAFLFRDPGARGRENERQEQASHFVGTRGGRSVIPTSRAAGQPTTTESMEKETKIFMTSEERDLITGLFNRLRAADTTAKDQEAEQLIGQLTGRQPGAPYRLVQTLLVQEHALSNATVRIRQLEQQVADAAKIAAQSSQGGGSFLSGLFGHHAAAPAVQPPPIPAQQIPPQTLPPQPQGYTPVAPTYPSTVTMAPSAGSGFLRGALQTAAGVAGGALIAQGIENLLGHHSGPFGGGYGGGGGFFGGGYGGGGYGGGGDRIVENNTEIVNNYIDERGEDRSGGFAGASSHDPGSHETQREDNRSDVERGIGSGTFDDGAFDTSNPFDAPADDPGSVALDNTFDSDNTDANTDSGSSFLGDGGSDVTDGSGGNDDSSYV